MMGRMEVISRRTVSKDYCTVLYSKVLSGEYLIMVVPVSCGNFNTSSTKFLDSEGGHMGDLPFLEREEEHRRATPMRKNPSAPYCRLFSTQYGGMGYKMQRKPAKSKYLDFLDDSHQVVCARSRGKKAVEARTRNIAMAFDAADENQDGTLTFDEFKQLVYDRMPSQRGRSEALLHSWYMALDTDGDGSLSKVEYFAFALREAFLSNGSGQSMDSFFNFWGGSNDGKIDRDEFITLAERLGFGGVADELMSSIDSDGSGVIDYREFVQLVKDRTSSAEARSFVMAAARSGTRPPMIMKAVPHAPDPDLKVALRNELLHALMANGSAVLDFFRKLDASGDGLLTVVELSRALSYLNQDVPPRVVQELYDEIDREVAAGGEDGVTIGEMNRWLLTKVDRMEHLQQELRRHLQDRGQEMIAIFESWEIDADARVSSSELGRAVTHLGLDVTPEVISRTFDEIDVDGNGSVAMAELSQWLLRKLDSAQQLQQDIRDAMRMNGAQMINLFEQWDISGDDAIDAEVLGRALKAMGYDAPHDNVVELFSEMDLDGDGRLSAKELNVFLLQRVNSKEQLLMALREGMRAHGQRVIHLFRGMDKDEDALLTQDEFIRGLRELGFYVPDKTMVKLFDELDEDANWRISFAELNRWLMAQEPPPAEPRAAPPPAPRAAPSPASRVASASRPSSTVKSPKAQKYEPPPTSPTRPRELRGMLRSNPSNSSKRSLMHQRAYNKPQTTENMDNGPPHGTSFTGNSECMEHVKDLLL